MKYQKNQSQHLFIKKIYSQRIVQKRIILGLFFFCFCHILLPSLQAQVKTDENKNSQDNALKVFIDGHIDDDYMKREVRFVNYVRDTRMADVYLLVTSQSTGSGGNEYTITYQGQNNYAGINDTLKFIRNSTDTYEIYRRGLIKLIKQGLMRYVVTTPAVNDISVSFKPSVTKVKPPIDKWKKWVFNIGFDVELDGEKYEKDWNLDFSLSARKITEKWKFSSHFSYDYSQNEYDYDDRTIKDIRRDLHGNGQLAKKLGDHWALGVNGRLNSNIRRNDKLSTSFTPQIEYNIFPYSEFSRRQFPIRIGLGLNHHDYYKETIYDKTSEFLSSLNMSAVNVVTEKWGSVINVLDASFYLHDFNKNNFEWVNILNFRLFKGFSMNTLLVVNLIHNQLYLEKEDLTVEEVLLERKQLETSYNYFISFGFSYSFGSMYQNIVNPRFGY
jgi:hypothetical protein